MKKVVKGLSALVMGGAMVVAFQNCGSEHMAGMASNSSTSGGMDPAAFAALQTQALNVLSTRCASCHNGTVSGTVPDVLNITELRQGRYVIPGQPQNSPIMLAIYDRQMPPGGNMVDNQPNEVAVLRDWIQALK